jgi:hypothetical protein
VHCVGKPNNLIPVEKETALERQLAERVEEKQREQQMTEGLKNRRCGC